MRTAADAPVVVGVDGSPSALAAVRLAAREAVLHARPLRIVHAFNWAGVPPGDEPRTPARRIADQAVAAAREVEPAVPVDGALIEGPSVTTLLRESGSAALVVVGDGGLAGRSYLAVDATCVQIAARAGCSVLVAREGSQPAGPVLVGVDGSEACRCALDFAFDEAACRAAPLVAVWVWHPADRSVRSLDAAADRLAHEVTEVRRRFPGVPVSERVRSGDPEDEVIDESRNAGLVVLSGRGEQPWRGMLGAVSQSVLRHSPAPVVIARPSHGLYVQE